MTCPDCGAFDPMGDEAAWHKEGCTVNQTPTAQLRLRHRVTAWLSFKLGKRPSDTLLDYCAQWAATPSLRHEAARQLAKRRARHEAALLRAGLGVGGKGRGGGTVD